MEGNVIVSGSKDKTVRVWDASSGQVLHVLEGHSHWVRSVAMEGNVIVSRDLLGSVLYWDVQSGAQLPPSDINTAVRTALPVQVQDNVHVSVSGLVGYTVDSAIQAAIRNDKFVVVGDKGGQVHILRICEQL